jgi:hypothetical protein
MAYHCVNELREVSCTERTRRCFFLLSLIPLANLRSLKDKNIYWMMERQKRAVICNVANSIEYSLRPRTPTYMNYDYKTRYVN